MGALLIAHSSVASGAVVMNAKIELVQVIENCQSAEGDTYGDRSESPDRDLF